MRFTTRRKALNLALQGGGAHGAFTWGVLDEFLEDEELAIGWLSGTSAGAVNAVAVAHGLAVGDKRQGRAALAAIWKAVENAGVPELLRRSPFLSGFAKAASMSNITSLFSPYELNPLGFDPLRDILKDHIDFETIRRSCPVDIVIAATDVATGRARLFRKEELTVDAVLASACLPTVHHAVEIGGRVYWDGGFSANPDLLTLGRDSPVRDTLIVQLNPIRTVGFPRSPREIEDRVNTLTFNQPLLRDIEMIVQAQKARRGWLSRRSDGFVRLARHRFHLIEAGRHTAGMGSDTKALPDTGVLTYLHGAGRIEARRWLGAHSGQIGHRATIDLEQTYLSDAAGDGVTDEGSEQLDVFQEPAGKAAG